MPEDAPGTDPPESPDPPEPTESPGSLEPPESHEADEEEGGGRASLRRALLRPSRSQVVVGVLLAALGFGAVAQVRAGELDNTYASYREQDLIDVLTTMTAATERAEGELAKLGKVRRDLRSDTRRRAAALAQAQQTVDTLNILSGAVPVTGPGITITVTETDGTVDVGSVLDTVQELRTAGAEAMEFNDTARVVAQTSFADGVGGLLVGDQLVSSPYRIDVIGDPDTLKAAMVFPQGPVDQLEEDGATVDIERRESLKIQSVWDGARLQFAEPGTGQ